MRYDLLIFDFDGTIVDTAPDIAHYVNEVLVEFGYPPRPTEAIHHAIGRGVHHLMRELASGFGENQEELTDAVALFKKRYAAKPVVKTRPFPGIPEVLESLSATKKVVITNKLANLTERILGELDLRKHFDMVIGDGSGFPMKPDPASTLHALQALGARPSATVFIGDSGIDLETSNRAGVDFLWVSYGYDRVENSRNLRICDSAEALLQALKVAY